MSKSNGSVKRSETDRLLGRPVKLFTVDTGDGKKEISVPVLPAALSMEWLKIYNAALDKQGAMSRMNAYYEGKEDKDWGAEADLYKTRDEWNAGFEALMGESIGALMDAFYSYGEICAEKLGVDNPLDRGVLERVVTSEQIMNGLTEIREINDPLRCWENSLLMRQKELQQRVSS